MTQISQMTEGVLYGSCTLFSRYFEGRNKPDDVFTPNPPHICEIGAICG
jgi:hypothetical protein